MRRTCTRIAPINTLCLGAAQRSRGNFHEEKQTTTTTRSDPEQAEAHAHLLLTMSLAKEHALLNDAGLLSGDAPHFRRNALTAPPPPPAPMEDRLERLTEREHPTKTTPNAFLYCIYQERDTWGGGL